MQEERVVIRRTGAGAAIAGACALAAGAATAGIWSPGLGVGARIERWQSGALPERDVLVQTVTPELGYGTGAGDWAVQLLAARRYEFSRAGAGPGPSAVGAADRSSLHVGRSWSETSDAAIDARYDRTPEILDVPERTAFVPGDVTRWVGSARASLWRLEGEGRVQGWSYSARGADDASSFAWSARFLPVLGRDGAWFIGWHERRLELDGRTAVRSRMATLGVRRRLTPLLAGELEVGGAAADYRDGARERGPALILGLTGASGAQSLTTRWTLEPDLATGFSAEIGHELGDGRLWARGESLLDVEGGVYRVPTITRRLTLGAQDTLARSTVLGCQAGCTRAAPHHFAGEGTQSARASAWLARRLSPWLVGRGEWSYLRLLASEGAAVAPQHRARFDVTLTAAWD